MIKSLPDEASNFIQMLADCGMITDIDTAISQYEELEKRQREKYVIQKIGSVSKEPNYKNKTLYRKRVTYQDIYKEITAESYDKLIQKIFDFVSALDDDKTQFMDTSFRAIYKIAHMNYVKTTNRSSQTYASYDNYYKRFISEDFEKTDIRTMTVDYLKAYAKELVTRLKLDKKTFNKFKSVLNMAFNYAYEYEIIKRNPAPFVKATDFVVAYANRSMPTTETKIFTIAELEKIKTEIRKRMTQKKYGAFYALGYAILLSILTGMRAAEICALKWSDIQLYKQRIWIHSQQLKEITPKGQPNTFYDVPWTKNEKRMDKPTGRYFPISYELNALLNEISEKQRKLGIDSMYVICDETGDSIKTPAYETGLRRLCQSLGFEITNNHAFRMTLNSLVLIPAGFTVTERAAMLGHSVQTNLMYYSFDPRDSELEKADRLNTYLEGKNLVPTSPQSNIVDIRTKKIPQAL